MPEVYIPMCLAALAAGVLNAVAGGGTLLTFPVLLTVISSVGANATSTVALVPGSAAGAWGYRKELGRTHGWALVLLLPCIIGGAVGALLVTRLPESYFEFLVPWLILLATLLFLAQPTIARVTGIGRAAKAPSGWRLAGVVFFQFFVAVYGGYFGAGIGILMLSALALVGLDNIHEMNALKTILAACINLVAVAVFIASGEVWWRYAIPMAVAAVAGGYLGARVARRFRPVVVRWIVIAIGLGLSAYFLWRGAGVERNQNQALEAHFVEFKRIETK